MVEGSLICCARSGALIGCIGHSRTVAGHQQPDLASVRHSMWQSAGQSAGQWIGVRTFGEDEQKRARRVDA